MFRLFILIIMTFFSSVVTSASALQRHLRSTHVTPASQEELYPPLILLGGIAQTKSSWDHHLKSLAKNRTVIVYECLGQGDHTMTIDTKVDASLPAQARILLETLDSIKISNGTEKNPTIVDIAGFSFGGRVAMAAACLQSDNSVRIRRLHLTGVGCDRTDLGHLAIRSFSDIIRSDPSLRSFAWSILLATYSSRYLHSLPEATLERFLNHISSSNNPEGLLAMIEQAEVTEESDPWHVTKMTDRLVEMTRSQSVKIIGRLCVGEFDKMAPVDEVQRLRERSDWIQKEVDILRDSGHAVVLEKPRVWRESVLSFLNENDSDGNFDLT